MWSVQNVAVKSVLYLTVIQHAFRLCLFSYVTELVGAFFIVMLYYWVNMCYYYSEAEVRVWSSKIRGSGSLICSLLFPGLICSNL